MNSVWKTIVTSLANYWKENCPDVCPELNYLHECLNVEEKDLAHLPQWGKLMEVVKSVFPGVELNENQFNETDRTIFGLLLLINYSKKISSSDIEGLCALSKNNKAAVSNLLRSFNDIANEDITRETVIAETCKRSRSPRKRRRRGRKGDKSAHSVQSCKDNGQGNLSGDDMFCDGASDNNDGMEQAADDDYKHFKDIIQNLKDTISVLENEKISFMSILEVKNNGLEKLNELEEQSNTYRLRLEEAENLLKEKCTILEENQNEITSVKSELSTERSNKEKIEKELNEKSQYIANLEIKMANLTDEKEQMTSKYHEKMQESIYNKNLLEDSMWSCTDLKTRLEKVIQDKDELFKALSEKDKEMRTLNARFETINKEKELVDVDVILKGKYIQRMEEQVKNLEPQNESLQLELNNLKNDYEVCSADLRESKCHIDVLEVLNRNNCGLIENLETELKSLAEKWQQATEELDNLKSIESSTRTEIETLRFYNEQLMKSNDTISSQINEKNAIISRLTDRCEELSKDVIVLRSNFETKTKEILVLDKAFIEKKKEMDEMRALVKHQAEELASKKEEISSITLKAKETDAELIDLKGKYEAALKDVKNLELLNAEKESQVLKNSEMEVNDKRKDSFVTLFENQASSQMCTNDCLVKLDENEDSKGKEETAVILESRIRELEVNNHSISMLNNQLKDEVDHLSTEKSELVDLVGKLRLDLEAKTKKKKKKDKTLKEPQAAQEDSLECTAKTSKKFTLTWTGLGGLFSSQKSKVSLNSKEKLESASTSAQNGDTLIDTPRENSQQDADCQEQCNVFSRVILESKFSQVCFEFLSLSYILFSLLCSTSVILVSKVANPLNFLFKDPFESEPQKEENAETTTTAEPTLAPDEAEPPLLVNESDST